MTSDLHEPPAVLAAKEWLQDHGGSYHQSLKFCSVPSGLTAIATKEIPTDSTIISCPFSLAITLDVARTAVSALLGIHPHQTVQWSERQWICLYICLHWLVADPSNAGLMHSVYLAILPPAEKLCTSLHFTPSELEKFKGTNLYGATVDRERDWRAEWSQCHNTITEKNPEWGRKFSWGSYLTAATYLSSRAFPSTLLSATPSLTYTPTAHPILLPGIDSLNHARAHPVSWVITYPSATNNLKEPTISLVLHTSTPAGQEVFNNYGAKPNSELILGYGFSIPNNPDDTIILKIGGIENKHWEIGRGARGAEDLLTQILSSLTQDSGDEPTYEDHLDAAEILMEMTTDRLSRLPPVDREFQPGEVRPEVARMLIDYVQGQSDILQSIVAFAEAKEQLVIDMAEAEGVEIPFEDS